MCAENSVKKPLGYSKCKSVRASPKAVARKSGRGSECSMKAQVIQRKLELKCPAKKMLKT